MNEGTIVQCIGAVIDVEFSRTTLPNIYDALTLEGTELTLEVQQQLGDGVVRSICLGSSDGLRRGMKVKNTGAGISVPVGPKTLGRIMDVLGRPIDELGPIGADKAMPIHRDAPSFEELSPSTELLETGIKVIDVMCPLTRGGTVAIAAEYAAGTMVVTEEICRRVNKEPGGVSIFTFVPPGPGLSFQEVWAKEGFTGGTAGTVQTFYFVGEETWTVDRLAALPTVDAVIRLSRDLARLGIYPTIDAVISRSRLLDEKLVGPEHADVTSRVREALRLLAAPASEPDASTEPDIHVRRARKLLRFFAQPFFVAEAYTQVRGSSVSREESVRACGEILGGLHDDLPEKAFYFVGGIDEVRARAVRLSTGEHP
jgi:F0F1-type ATP synthase beta subunit